MVLTEIMEAIIRVHLAFDMVVQEDKEVVLVLMNLVQQVVHYIQEAAELAIVAVAVQVAEEQQEILEQPIEVEAVEVIALVVQA